MSKEPAEIFERAAEEGFISQVSAEVLCALVVNAQGPMFFFSVETPLYSISIWPT